MSSFQNPNRGTLLTDDYSRSKHEKTKEELWYGVTNAQLIAKEEDELWIKNNPNASIAEKMYPSMRKNWRTTDITGEPTIQVEPSITAQINSDKINSATNLTNNSLVNPPATFQEILFPETVQPTPQILFDANNLIPEQLQEPDQKRLTNSAKTEKKKHAEAEQIKQAQEFNKNLRAEYEVERQLKLKEKELARLGKEKQKKINGANQKERIKKYKEYAKNNSTWGDDFDQMTPDSIEGKGDKSLNKVHDSHTIPFGQGAASSLFGSGEAPKDMTPEQKASFENGLLTGTIAQGATGGYIAKMAGIGAGLFYTGLMGGNKERMQQIEKGEELSVPEIVNEGAKAMIGSTLPSLTKKIIPKQLKEINEIVIKTAYETLQQYFEDPESVNLETGANNATKNLLKAFGKMSIQNLK